MSDKHRNAALRSATAAFIRELLPSLLVPIREVARNKGYAIAVHGSLANDIDLLAVPWIETADPPSELIAAIQGAVAAVLGTCAILDESKPGDKPHGRLGVTYVLPQTHVYIDLAIMPPLAKEPQ